MSPLLKILMLLSLTLNLAWAQDPALRTDALKFWEKRDKVESLREAIKKFEELHKAAPADTEYLVYLTRGHLIMGDYYVSSKDDKLKQFEKAFSYGDKALETNPEYAARVKKNDEVKHAVEALGVNEVPQMYWTAASLGKFAKANGILASLKYKNKILSLISRVEKLRPDYFFGAVDRYWGSYYAAIPSLAGKDLKKSKKHFEKSIQMAPEYLGTKVLKAEIYSVEKDDKKEFRELLNEVISDTKHDSHPEVGPENRLEKIKAKKILGSEGDYF